ncbi:UbiA prenyltransferase family-domain-containing protein [Penicillium longicatenatum]|uniref:UbiA prenyltransferase family-domain-containing protein n=1 Tax=Penicillium longicatenatum TaxID=1561947 RepID=UPI0025493DA3|nr:UbiA prenyltransferase family-domain-containing protein [Penicillium longicatenatum]KAJ5657855.1 UbiA prenyltransferase family-domain-containing protein [Penicillium longicatenatum]
MASTITRLQHVITADKTTLKLNAAASSLPAVPTPAKKGGLLASLPPSLVPYAELMRLHQPAGVYASLVPTLIGLFLAAASPKLTPSSISRISPLTLLTITITHIVGNTLLRGAACAYNDAIDAPYDRLVARCKSRPVARGAVTSLQAHMFALPVFGLWIVTLFTLPSPETVVAPAALLTATMGIYPFCKRITHFPQLVLGISLALAQAIGYGSLGVSFSNTDLPTQIGLGCLYVSYVVHTMIYDTVYAHQDLEDDLKAGILSMAVLCRGRTKVVLSRLAAVEVGLLAATGWTLGLEGPSYRVGAVGGTAMALGTMVKSVRLDEPKNCRMWFARLLWWMGACVVGGLAGEYWLRV